MAGAVRLSASEALPADGFSGALAGRVWRPDAAGPSVVAIRASGVFDITAAFPTMRDLCETADPAASLQAASAMRSQQALVMRRSEITTSLVTRSSLDPTSILRSA